MPAYLGIADRADSPFGPRPVRFVVMFDTRKRLAFILQGAGQHDLRNIASDKEFIKTIFSFDRMITADFKIAKVPKWENFGTDLGKLLNVIMKNG